MEKYLSAAGYWLGLICTVLAIISRVLLAFDSNPLRIGVAEGLTLSYISFFSRSGPVLPAGHRQLVSHR